MNVIDCSNVCLLLQQHANPNYPPAEEHTCQSRQQNVFVLFKLNDVLEQLVFNVVTKLLSHLQGGMQYNKYNTQDNKYNTQYNKYNTQYNTCNTQYNKYNTQYNTCNTQYNTCNTQYNKYNTQDNKYNTQYNTCNTQYNKYNTQYWKSTEDIRDLKRSFLAV
ncbi:putative uncharacterized protein DDB_G0291786 [Clinocottus analis]|uniref:putative uncharacterized protein DDB_G0291786 n=1 Tax=Clinocottus analis TaxID=304258 RepID=UPI0035BF8853